ncbi:MAG: WecB/TagA/CpsF family glycosyltransferase [Chloroflexi bacterium]|nr:MAG: WecB/TagA/CpsF family glycosyltransferase [Chloroflexota bacterium]
MTASSSRYRVGAMDVDPLRFADVLELLAHAPVTARPLDVHFCAAHAVVEARDDPRLSQAFRDAALVCPDGMPLVWVGRAAGRRVERVCGPDMMLALLDRSRADGRTHFFYGGADGVAERLASRMRERYPDLRIVGCETPPFRALSDAEETELASRINAARPDYVWCGLGTPRQYLWISRFRERLRAAALLAVGAAFDFHAGVRPRAPRWLQRAGFEWLFRLVSEPRRLGRRYTIANARFLALLLGQALDVRDLGERR